MKKLIAPALMACPEAPAQAMDPLPFEPPAELTDARARAIPRRRFAPY